MNININAEYEFHWKNGPDRVDCQSLVPVDVGKFTRQRDGSSARCRMCTPRTFGASCGSIMLAWRPCPLWGKTYSGERSPVYHDARLCSFDTRDLVVKTLQRAKDNKSLFGPDGEGRTVVAQTNHTWKEETAITSQKLQSSRRSR